MPISQLPDLTQKTTCTQNVAMDVTFHLRYVPVFNNVYILRYKWKNTKILFLRFFVNTLYIECETSIIDNKGWKMVLSNIEFWRVEVDILKFHWNKLKIGNFQRFIWNILNHLLYFNPNQSFLVSFVHPGSTPHHFSSGLSLQSSEISGVTFDFLEKLRMCCAVLPMSILVRLR